MNKNPFYSIYLRGLLLLVLSFVLCEKAMAYDVSGNVNASSLPDNAEVVLTGNTTINRDVDKTISCIKGNYSLIIKGNNTLTVNNSIYTAIDVEGDITIIGGKLFASSATRGCGIRSTAGDINLSGTIEVGVVSVQMPGIAARMGSITSTADITINGRPNYGIYANKECSINGGTIKVTDETINESIKAGGNITIAGNVKVKSFKGHAILSNEGDINLSGTIEVDVINVQRFGIGALMGNFTSTADITINGRPNYGIYANKECSINGGTIKVTDETINESIKAGGNITIAGNVKVKSFKGHAILSNEGDINLSGTIEADVVSVQKTGIGALMGNIISTADITINGRPNYGIYANKNCSINGGTVKVTEESINETIKAGGDITIAGNVKAMSHKSYSISSNTGDIIFDRAKVAAVGGPDKSAISTSGTITLKQCGILTPNGGTISGKSIVDSEGNPARFVFIGEKVISSTINYTGLAVPGVNLGFTLSEELAPAVIHCQWQESSNGTTWTDIVGAKDNVYVPTESQINKYVRVIIEAEGYTGFITGRACYVKKNSNTEKVVQMTLGSDGDQVYVAYAVPSQEYFILSYKKDVANLTASDWANAVSPSSSGKLVMGGAKGCTNYVYTRKKETISTLPGNSVVCEQIYLGDETKVLQGLKLDVALMEMDGKSPYFTALDKEDNAYYVRYGNVLRIRVSPLPSTATFYGVAANRWITKIVNGYPCGGFFANYQCTQELEEGQNYKEVYYKAWKQINYNEVRAEVTSGGPNSLFTDAFYLHVANESGEIIMDSYQTENVTIGRGEKQSGFQVNTRPLKATLSNAYAFVANNISSEGKEPKVTFDNETRTMSVDATEADQGTYYYTVYQCGNAMSNKIRVDVTAPAVEAISLIPDAVSLDRGESMAMTLQLAPTDSKAKSVTWEVMNTDLASISDDGVLTVKADAPRGNSCIVRVTVDSKYQKECMLTVPKLVPDLSFSETSFEINVGVPFTAPTLVNPDGLSVTYSSSDENVATVNAYTGAVTIKGYGNVFIIASYAGDSDYEAGSASYGIVINRLPCDLAYSVTTASANVGETFTGPMLTNPHSLTVTYTSDDPFVAIIDENTGKVTPLDNGTTTITAWFDGNETYEPGDVSYDLTVYAKGDVNRDGQVNQTDVDLTAQHILGKKPAGFYEDAADMNGDKKINAADIVLINKEIKP